MKIKRTENSILLTDMSKIEKEFFEDKILFWEFLCNNDALLHDIVEVPKLKS